LARTRLADVTRAFSDGKLPCLVATAGLFQEGVSIDGIEVLIQAGGLKSKAKVIQAAGRGMRLSPGKNACTYYDFMDDDEAGVFRAHARKRIAALKEEGFFVTEGEARSTSGSFATPAGGPDPPPSASSDPGQPRPDGRAWFHVPDTKRFLLVDDEGQAHATGMCLKKSLVPTKVCNRCKDETVCERGGRILWQEE
jgi:superfamily II DNA or RNA helicase